MSRLLARVGFRPVLSDLRRGWPGFLLHVGAALLGSVLLAAYLQSESSGVWPQRPALLPTSSGGYPLTLAVVLFLGSAYLLRGRLSHERWQWPSHGQACIAVVGILLCAALVVKVYHPPEATIRAVATAGRQSLLIGEIIGAALQLAVLLPVPFVFLLFVPGSFLRRHCGGFLLCGGVFVLYLLLTVIEGAFHVLTLSFLLREVAAVLRLFSDAVAADPATLSLQFHDYAVRVGPLCSGADSLLLFALLFGAYWLHAGRQGRLWHGKAAVAFAAGLVFVYALNVLRVVLLMMVGATSPEAATALFHGTAGAVLFFAVFLLYVAMVIPRFVLRRENRR